MKPGRSEASIQKSVVEFARKKGCICIKQGGAGSRGSSGWPDHLILTPSGVACFIEFKKPGGKATELQAYRIKQLLGQGVPVEVVDDVAYGRKIIDGWLEAT
jgi:hypothetical protein